MAEFGYGFKRLRKTISAKLKAVLGHAHSKEPAAQGNGALGNLPSLYDDILSQGTEGGAGALQAACGSGEQCVG